MAYNRIKAQWRPEWFFLLHGLAALLLMTWLWPVTRQMWDGIDSFIYRHLNQTLVHGGLWSKFWAFGNSRYFDAMTAVLLAVFILRKNIIFKRIEVRRGVVTIALLLGVLLAVRSTFTKVVDHVGWQRSSPSRIDPNAVRLSHQFPEFKTKYRMKDSSPRSFPGDHGSVLIAWGIFVIMFARGKRKILPLLAVIILLLPRLIAGAHWFTDLMVGSTFIALVALAWAYCTPLGRWADAAAEKIAAPVVARLRRLRPLKRLSILQ